MKTNINLVILLLCNFVLSFAQNNTNYYLESKTFTREGYTYQCDVSYRMVRLYNKGNQFVYQDMIYKNSGKVFEGLSIKGPLNMHEKLESIINGAFTEEEAKTFDIDLGVTL